MALNIKDPETDALARRLATITGEKITDAVKTAVRERLEREERCRDPNWLEQIKKIQDELAAIPDADPTFTEDSLYGENGLPR